MNTILITGSKGFIGKNLLSHLRKKGQEIIIEVNEDIFELEDWRIELKRILIANQPDVVFHVGACSDTLEKDVNYMMKLNFEFTKVLADWTYDNDKKLIYSSSAASYGTDLDMPSNLYGWSKYIAEQYVISKNGIGLRYFNVYGPGEEHKGKMASVAYQAYLQKMKGNIQYLFPKNPKRDFVYVKDVVYANLFAAKHFNKIDKNWYDVGSGESRSFEEVMIIMGVDYEYHDEKKIPKGYQFFTCSNENNWMPGWKSKYTIEKGVKEYRRYLEQSMKK